MFSALHTHEKWAIPLIQSQNCIYFLQALVDKTIHLEYPNSEITKEISQREYGRKGKPYRLSDSS